MEKTAQMVADWDHMDRLMEEFDQDIQTAMTRGELLKQEREQLLHRLVSLKDRHMHIKASIEQLKNASSDEVKPTFLQELQELASLEDETERIMNDLQLRLDNLDANFESSRTNASEYDDMVNRYAAIVERMEAVSEKYKQ